MNCPECGSKNNRTPVTNGHLPDQVVRKRVCGFCGHAWFTVEMAVPDYAIGWSDRHQHKPVLRTRLTLEPSFVEAADVMENLAKANAAIQRKTALKHGEDF
jgi:transcriptional regulator NrdR family protein